MAARLFRVRGSFCDFAPARGSSDSQDRRATYLHHQSWKRGCCTGRGSYLHTVVALVNTTCSHCDQHFDPVAMLLEHLRAAFPLDQRNAELGLDAGVGNAGDEATGNEAQSRPTGAAEPGRTEADVANSIPSCLEARSGDPRAASGHLHHDACEARRTFGAGEQSGHGTFRDQIAGGSGQWASRTFMDGRPLSPL